MNLMKTLYLLLCLSLCSCAIEKPDYEVLEEEGDFEVRKYDSIPVVSAPMEDMENRNSSFRRLFRYISGDNEKAREIEMTSPVFMEMGDGKEAAPETGRMSFMIPAEVDRQGAPEPTEEALEVTTIEEGMFAVLRFKGWRDQAKQAQARRELLEKVGKRRLKPIGDPFYAFYNPPWTPELLRRNEVWQRVERE